MNVRVTVDFQLPADIDEYYINKVVQQVGATLEPFVIGKPEWDIKYTVE